MVGDVPFALDQSVAVKPALKIVAIRIQAYWVCERRAFEETLSLGIGNSHLDQCVRQAWNQ